MSYRRQGQWDRVIEELQAALRVDAGFANAHIELGKVYARMGDWDKALNQLRTVLRIRPDLPAVYFYMGLVYLEQKKWEDAESHFKKTLEIDSSHREALMGLEVARGNLSN